MKTRSGFVVTRGKAVVLILLFLCSLTAVGLLVYFFTERPCATLGGSVESSTPASETSSSSSQSSSKIVENIRLPRDVLPHHYDVRLLPILETGNFSILGRVSVDIECKEVTDRIVLHSVDIVVDPKSVQLIHKVNQAHALSVSGIDYDTKLEFLIVRLDHKLTKGSNYTLSMDFVGNLTDRLKGFYRSNYKEDGETKFLAVSQMEPTDARRAFPCFDEPNMKSTFTVTLGRHRDMTSLSNMPLKNSQPIEGMKDFFWDQFEKSVPMSTYLVGFVVADFIQVRALDTNNAKWDFNIFARPSAQNQTHYARKIGPKILTFFEDYFQIPYPLPKQDMIAIPDFAAGAMENWGLITYRETSLLYDEKASSINNKGRVTETVAHELAHQWFGNLVTMDWWTDLWLNEGFASYLEYLGSDHVEPNFKWLQQFVTKDLQDVMGLDSLESSHPISVVVHHPDEINEIFDRISYGKGATIIRMLAHFIGEQTFRQGLTNYLKSRQYGNAVQNDLWEAFTQQAKQDKVPLPASVKEIMDTWTLKMGFPVITVQRDYKSRNVTLTQERFLLQRSNSSNSDETVYLWWVPLSYTTDFKNISSTWLSDTQSTKILSLESDVPNDQWLIFNVDETGYFRVNYDTRNWQLINEQLTKNHPAISVTNRAQIMDDSLNLAQAGLLDYDLALNLTLYLEREDEFLPWDATFSSLSYVASMMSRTPGYGLFKKHVKRILTPLYESLGFNQRAGDSPLTIKLRILAVSWACSMGIKDCVNNAKRSYAQWMADPENKDIISPNVKGTVVCVALREGDEEEWDFAFSRYLVANVASEQSLLLSALSCSRQSWILAKLLEMSVNSTSGIRKQDASRVISQVASNPLGRFLAFSFIKERWEDLRKIFSSFSGLARIISSVSSSFNTELEIQEFMRFRDVRKELLANAARSTQQSIDRAKNNLNWMKKNYIKVVDWLQHNYP